MSAAFVAEHLGDGEAVFVIDETGGSEEEPAHRRRTSGVLMSSRQGGELSGRRTPSLRHPDDPRSTPPCTCRHPAATTCNAVAGVPEQVRFATKPHLAARMIADAVDAGLPCRVGGRRRGLRQ